MRQMNCRNCRRQAVEMINNTIYEMIVDTVVHIMIFVDLLTIIIGVVQIYS
jgi:hypothetical protein